MTLFRLYRLIDFTLSNCANSQMYNIVVIPQYKSQSLNEHLEAGWSIFSILAPPARFVFKNEQGSRVGQALERVL